MFKIREVKKVGYSNFNRCNVVRYDDDDGYEKFAACVEDLYVECGDKIEIYSDDHVNYHGIGAMVLRIVN